MDYKIFKKIRTKKELSRMSFFLFIFLFVSKFGFFSKIGCRHAQQVWVPPCSTSLGAAMLNKLHFAHPSNFLIFFIFILKFCFKVCYIFQNFKNLQDNFFKNYLKIDFLKFSNNHLQWLVLPPAGASWPRLSVTA